MHPSDPAWNLMADNVTTTPDPLIYRKSCYICTDSDYARMGLPLCYACPKCQMGHIAADDTTCDRCGHRDTPDGESVL
jgi:hypothetical protein